MSEVQLSHLLPSGTLKAKVAEWLAEDIPSFDYGGAVVGEKQEQATLLGKADGILAGVPFFNEVFSQLGCSVEWFVKEGERFSPHQPDGSFRPVVLARVAGPVRFILTGERTALNILSRACGIATLSRSVMDKAREKNWKGRIAGTRKTTPGFRLVEKYALLVGGADTHRMDLSSMVMLKDNHIWSAGNITKAVAQARSVAGFSLKIEVECRNEKEAEEAISAGADVVMLDNFTPELLHTVAKRLKEKTPHVVLEVSGGITPATVQSYCSQHVDILSMGNLTQGVPHIDISLKIVKQN